MPNRAAVTAPSLSDPAMVTARNSQLADSAAMFGRQATLLTGSQGVTTPAPVMRKTLLGGAG